MEIGGKTGKKALESSRMEQGERQTNKQVRDDRWKAIPVLVTVDSRSDRTPVDWRRRRTGGELRDTSSFVARPSSAMRKTNLL